MNELNLGQSLEQAQSLVKYWHGKWAAAQLKVDWYEAPEQTKYVVRLYSELSQEDRAKIDNLLQALLRCK